MSYLSKDETYEYNDLACWYQNSIDETQPPIWTDEHLEELLNDFYIIPKDTPTADVVPKSEVDLYRKQVDELEDELASTYDKLENAKAEIETLKDNNEHLAVMLEETKAEFERLQAEKDALIKNYAECMKDYAREIFAEVNMQIFPYSTDIYIKGEELIIIPKSDYNAILAELEKKYTEGEDKPAASEEKYFSPEEVRKMTNQEVREKYTAIRKSMERW